MPPEILYKIYNKDISLTDDYYQIMLHKIFNSLLNLTPADNFIFIQIINLSFRAQREIWILYALESVQKQY